VKLSNQRLSIPPDHPIAKQLYDLLCIECTIVAHMSPAHYDASREAEHFRTLTYANGHPVVDGRSSIGEPFIHSSEIVALRSLN
jgi:hypothetical protein